MPLYEFYGFCPSSKFLVPLLQGKEGDPDRFVFCEGGYNVGLDEEAFEGCEKFRPKKLDKHSVYNENHLYYPKVYLQMKYPETVCRTVMIRNREVKYIKRTTGENELYIYSEDPLELHNKYEEMKDSKLIRDLEKEILEWYMNTSDTIPFERDHRLKPEHLRHLID